MKPINVIVYTGNSTLGNNGYVKYRKINNLDRFKKFIDVKFPDWKFATIYDNLTKEKINVIKR